MVFDFGRSIVVDGCVVNAENGEGKGRHGRSIHGEKKRGER